MPLRIIDELDVTVFRVASIAYYQRCLSAIGARSFSGRFNRFGLSALYFSETAETALSEYWGGDPLRPAVVIPIRLKLKSVIDIVAGTSRAPRDWQQWRTDWTIARDAPVTTPPADCASWRCGDDVIRRNCSAIRFPATKSAGVNIVAYPEDALIGGVIIEPLDPRGEIGVVHAPRS